MENLRIRLSTKADIPAIQALLRSEPQKVLEVDAATLGSWIDKRMSLVAEKPAGSGFEIVGHQAASEWPAEVVGKDGLVEFRSAVIHEDHRGNGLNMDMKQELIKLLVTEHPHISEIVVLKNGVSNGTKILLDLGFTQVEPHTLPQVMLDFGGDQHWKVYTKSLRS